MHVCTLEVLDIYKFSFVYTLDKTATCTSSVFRRQQMDRN